VSVTVLFFSGIVLAVVFFLVRPELWHRLWCARVDPRPLGLTRIVFGLVTLWNFAALASNVREFLTDEGMWLPDMARARFGGALRHLWDPEHGFEHWWSPALLPYGQFTTLHYGNPPWLVFALYALMLAALGLMVLGVWTRWTTIGSWVLMLQVYRFQPMYLSGGDWVIQNFLFLGMLSDWGEAYSIDGWRRRRAVIPTGAPATPPRPIAAWPIRLMMLQLAIIYCATGLLKQGEVWATGEALYYVLNLDHFYRVPAQALVAQLQHVGLLPLLTHVVRWWEILFPLALIGAAVRGYEADRAAGDWQTPAAWRRRLSWILSGVILVLVAVTAGLLSGQLEAAVLVALMALGVIGAYRFARQRLPRLHRLILHWLLGKRLWFLVGVLLHVGIDLGVNVGSFPEIMLALFLPWLSGAELARFWAFVKQLGGAVRP